MLLQTKSFVSSHNFANVLIDPSGQRGLYASRSWNAGDIICNFSSRKTLSAPNYLTVQRGESTHILLKPLFLQYINHSCDPNVFFDTKTMQLIALKAIEEHDALCFFYPSTEWFLEQPFVCGCGSSDCLGLIQGASMLSQEKINHYRFTEFINGKLGKY